MLLGMRSGLSLLLLAECAVAVHAGSLRIVLQSSASCPIDQCNDNACVYNSRRQSWTCSSCKSPLVPNRAKSACVCPAGQYPTVGTRRCAPCPQGFYCPRSNVAGQSTAKACPRNMVTVAVGAKAVTDCVNKPGFKLVRTATGVRAEACEVDTYSPGLAQQPQCTKCPPGFKTNPELVPGSQTTSEVCVAEPGYFVAGDTSVPCPQGEYNDKYDMATSCTPCSSLFDEEYAAGITTAGPGAKSERDCRVAEPGYVLVSEKKSAYLTQPDTPGYKLGGAKLCPQKYFCPGGDVELGLDEAKMEDGNPYEAASVGFLGAAGGVKLWTAGIPIACPGSTWTEDEGAKTVTECVAPPGFYAIEPTASSAVVAVECPTGTYKEEWNRAAGCKSCEDPSSTVIEAPTSPWLSDQTIYINELDATTGLVNRQIPTRGSPDSCYIQKGMGTLTVVAGDGGVTLLAQVCPTNSYGIDGTKKYGHIATPCTSCPANMVTALSLADATVKISSYKDSTGSVTITNTDDKGYFGTGACLTQAGYGYYNGKSYECPKGTYNAAGNKLPCTTCPIGTTTDATAVNAVLDDCNLFMAGYGLVAGVVAQCPLGTFGTQDRAVSAGACEDCPGNRWTPANGAQAGGASVDGVGCTLCAAGYGDDTWDPMDGTVSPTCNPCKDGLYGDLTRTNPKCQICPNDRTFSYAYGGAPDVVTPQATSPATAGSVSQCVTDFQQIVDGAFYINFVNGLVDTVNPIENAQSCVQECRDDPNCVAAHFNYDPNGALGKACKLWRPAGTSLAENPAAGATLAWKTMPSTVRAQSTRQTKAMGSGLYTYYWGVNVQDATTPLIDASTLEAVAGVTAVQDCLDACNNNNLCAGVSMTVDALPDTLSACSLIISIVQPGNALRTLTKTRYGSLQANAYIG